MNAIKDAELIGEYSNEDHWLPRKRHLKVNKTFTYTQKGIGKKDFGVKIRNRKRDKTFDQNFSWEFSGSWT